MISEKEEKIKRIKEDANEKIKRINEDSKTERMKVDMTKE
jgi:vacuolar-type H+-ATPase subunit E/Vma4